AIAEYEKVAQALLAGTAAKLTCGRNAVRAHADKIGGELDNLNAAIEAMEQALPNQHEGIIHANLELRKAVDALEANIDDQTWPLPKYREMLFIY
ncbi:MAG: hypothetical protein RR060_05970, partial [Victivallaceae bacterium]